MANYITNSEMLSDDVREVLASHETVIVSGQPTHHFTAEGKDFFYDDCSPVISMPLMVVNALVTHVPRVGYRHLDPIYIGDYPTISGENPDNGDAYIFGLIDDLNITIAAPDAEPGH